MGDLWLLGRQVSFGTSTLTQMTFGFSRDDIGGFLPGRGPWRGDGAWVPAPWLDHATARWIRGC